MQDILAGAGLLFQLSPMLWLVIGLVLGFVTGAIPGVGSANAAALLLPFAIGLPVHDSLILIAGLYAGCMFASAIPAILINAPGEPGSAATALDGYPMALAGKGERAIGIARMASAAGGTLAGIAVLFIIGPLGHIALKFGAVEIFLVAVFGLTVISVVIGDSVRKGIVAGVLGLLIAAMGANPLTGQPRFTLGFVELYGEVPFVPAVIGIFGVAQMFIIATQKDHGGVAQRADTAARSGIAANFVGSMKEAVSGIGETFRYRAALIRSATLGLLIGIVPGMGSSTSNFISYGLSKQYSRRPENYGKGEPEGIVASETSDSAVVSGTLVPTLALGIPGSATAAIVLAALYLHGLQPGPRLMATEAPLVYALILAAIVASILIVPIGAVMAAPLAAVTRVKPKYLVPVVLICCILGTYSMRNSVFDVGLLMAFGVLSFLMQRLGYPIVPLVLGLVLGPIAEENMLRALQLGNNEIGYFFQSGIAKVLWVGLAITIGATAFKAFRDRNGKKKTTTSGETQEVSAGVGGSEDSR